MGAKIIRVGDYVEVLKGRGNCGVADGEQGIVIDDERGQSRLHIMFPARVDLWNSEVGWATTARSLKLLYRPRI